MICACWPEWLRRSAETARLMVGVPDYDAYLVHFAAQHPEATALSRDAFYRERVVARYGGGGLRCC
jgi:uncharacterized short protein YbdD (DUF466 family)